MSEENKPNNDAVVNDVDQEDGILYLGMDLGTSRTAVAASNGIRESVLTAVGYPKDVVSKKLFKGREALFGEEAIHNRTSLNFHQPLAEGVIIHNEVEIKAAQDIIRHAMEMACSRKGDLIYAVIGAPAQASLENKGLIIDAVREVADSVIICSEPFAVAYGLDRLNETLVIDIGGGTIDLCRMHGTMPDADDQITLDEAGDHIDRTLSKLIKDAHPEAQFSIQMIKEVKDRFSTVEDSIEPIKVTLPVDGRPTEFDITKEMKEACLTIVPPIVGAINTLVATFEPEFQAQLCNNVLMGGGGSQIRGLDRAIERALDELGGGRVIKVEEPLYAGANGALKIAHDMPEEYWEHFRENSK
jgi:rod shape-determining protein MreB and related proteins